MRFELRGWVRFRVRLFSFVVFVPCCFSCMPCLSVLFILCAIIVPSGLSWGRHFCWEQTRQHNTRQDRLILSGSTSDGPDVHQDGGGAPDPDRNVGKGTPDPFDRQ
jgi:hypothetical protein